MKNRLRLHGVTGLAVLGLTMGTAHAAPALRVQVDQKGDFVLLGNTLGYECAAGTPAPVVGTVGACGNSPNDTAPDIFWRADSPMDGQAEANNSITAAQARSTAVLTLPAGATVTHAYLYWGAVGPSANPDTTVTLDRVGGFSATVNATASYPGPTNRYQSLADITALVQANGAGAYRVSDVDVAPLVNANNSNLFGGWWMVVFYTLATDPPRNLALFDGLDPVANALSQNATLSGFLVPNAGIEAKLGMIAYDGDNPTVGDQFFFYSGLPGLPLSDAQNPANNFFNGTRSYLGAPVSVAGDLPQLTGEPQSMGGIDLDVIDVTDRVVAGQTSANIQATSAGDVYFLAGFVTSIATFKPDFSSAMKTATDLNGGVILAGDVIEYSITAANTGNDAAVNTVLTDPLPMGVTYVPGSLKVTQGPNMGGKTDLPLDDQGEYDALGRVVTVRLGTGANGLLGGTIAVDESTTVVFQVTVDADASGTISNQASISAAGQQGATTQTTMTDGDGNDGGSQPTDVVVIECEIDANCAMPTPYCDTSGASNACVGCTMDAQCPGLLPICEPLGKTCICVSSGVELCDGIDNDCDGAIDQGDPGVGLPCSTGLPAACEAGLSDCSSGAIVCTPIIAAGSVPELCDGIDNDCDGAIDQGNPGAGLPCLTGLSGICDAGTTSCADGATVCTANTAPGSTPEICDNGIDDDCNGTVDDDPSCGAGGAGGGATGSGGGSSSSSGSGGNSSSSSSGSDGGFYAEGNGLLCSMRSGKSEGNQSAWLLALAAGAMVYRRRRAAP